MTETTTAGSGVATLRLCGGLPVLDLANTVSWRLDPQQRHDHLQTFPDLVTWAERAGVVSRSEASRLTAAGAAPAQGRALDRALALREAVHGVLGASPGTPRQQQEVAAAYRQAVNASRLSPGHGGWVWAERQLTSLTPLHRLAFAAIDLMTSGEASMVKRCADDSCGWLFLDRSRQRNRRWCSSADCGNRNRVRRHYQRHRDASEG